MTKDLSGEKKKFEVKEKLDIVWKVLIGIERNN